MAILHPFRSLRPLPEQAEEVACVPYDVINTSEARQLAAGKPLSFLHVIRPEIDLFEGIDEHDDMVYKMGASNLTLFRTSNAFMHESEPALYVYRLIMNGRSQTGIFGCVSVADYDNDTILKHEKTRPDKEDDRTRHILTQQAHAEPVMLTYPSNSDIDQKVNETMGGVPLYDFTASDGIQHTIWKIADIDGLVQAFNAIPKLYVADGHHRCKAASRAAHVLRTSGGADNDEYEFFPAVLFPMDQMHIMAYNRIVYSLPYGLAAFLNALRARFDLTADVDPEPAEPGRIALYLNGTWYGMTLPATNRDTVADALDVARLAEHILEPMLNITDPRTDSNIYFVGGIRGTQALEQLVDTGRAQMAISMYPTQIEELVAVSDAQLLMPPKSTWFEPKLRSGLLVHLF